MHLLSRFFRRGYATVNGRVTGERAREIFENPPLSKYQKPFDLMRHEDQLRRVYKHELYLEILSKRSVFIFQINGLTTPEYRAMQRFCVSKGMMATRLRNSVFLHALAEYLKVSGEEMEGMKWMVTGPCCAVFSDVDDVVNPRLVKDVVDVLKLKETKEKVLLMGGKMDKMFLTADLVHEVAAMPSLPQLRGELAMLLQSPAQQLTTSLERSQQQLVMSLESHAKSQETF